VHVLFFSRVFLLGILIFKGLTARRLYKSFGVNGLTVCCPLSIVLSAGHMFEVSEFPVLPSSY
jgi:hypothetical protein